MNLNKMKKLLLLGGSEVIIPVIEKAHELGIYVITCDYIPSNLAHEYSDKYYNVSVIEKELVLEVAKKEKVDGIMAFACDAGVVSAAYVAEKMSLPFQCSYEAARILQDKGLFRKFLKDNGFNSPKARRYDSIDAALNEADEFDYPVIVKPVDSAGSKGVTKVESKDDLLPALKHALEYSSGKAFIVEQFLIFKGYHSSTDPFTVSGKLQFSCFSDQLFDADADNPYAPTLIIWPSTMEISAQNFLSNEIQRLFDILKMRTGIYNIETCVDVTGTPYLMEVSPRGGGCKIAELQEMAYGIPFIENEIRKAVNMPLVDVDAKAIEGVWCEMVIHSDREGVFEDIIIDKDIKEKYVQLLDIGVKKGATVKTFTGGNQAIGNIFLKTKTREELDELISREKEWLKIVLK